MRLQSVAGAPVDYPDLPATLRSASRSCRRPAPGRRRSRRRAARALRGEPRRADQGRQARRQAAQPYGPRQPTRPRGPDRADPQRPLGTRPRPRVLSSRALERGDRGGLAPLRRAVRFPARCEHERIDAFVRALGLESSTPELTRPSIHVALDQAGSPGALVGGVSLPRTRCRQLLAGVAHWWTDHDSRSSARLVPGGLQQGAHRAARPRATALRARCRDDRVTGVDAKGDPPGHRQGRRPAASACAAPTTPANPGRIGVSCSPRRSRAWRAARPSSRSTGSRWSGNSRATEPEKP